MTVKDSDNKNYMVVGSSPIKHDGSDKTTGKAFYGADITLPGIIYGKVLRSPHAHAIIESIDISKALAHPDVQAVATCDDLEIDPPTSQQVVLRKTESHNILATDKVLYKGHPIAAIAASNPHLAEELLELIEVKYTCLKEVMDVETSLKIGSPVLHDHWEQIDNNYSNNLAEVQHNVMGDLEKGFQSADCIVEREFRTKSVHQGYIEPQTSTAWWSPENRLTIWTSTQGHFTVANNVSRLLGISNSQVKVIPMEIGGGFGGKNPIYLEPVAAVLSKKSGRPVKMTMTRSEVFEATGPTSGSYLKIKIGANNEGRILAAKAFYALEAGAYSGAPLPGASAAVFASYNIENVEIKGLDVVVNKPKTAAYRAPGAPIVSFGVETVIDEIASKLNIDPIEFRLKNVATENTRRADGIMNLRIGAKEVMEAVKKHPHYVAPIAKSNGKISGRGIAMGFCRNNSGESCVVANVLSDGTVSLIEGSVDIGGSRTGVAQQFAEVLGLEISDVIPQVGDTDTIGFTSNSGGSGVAFKTGIAAYIAANDVKNQIIQRASKIWDVPESDVEYSKGVVKHKHDDQLKLNFKEISHLLPDTGGPIVGRANINPPGSGASYSANIIDIQIDVETGKIDISKCTAFQDVGTAVNPDTVEGQIQGGTVQGIGWALNEEYYMNQKGYMVNNGFLDYRMPTTLDMPYIDPVIIEVFNPSHPFGVRGVGEANIVPPLPAIANAINNALDIRLEALPMNPSAVLSAIKSKNDTL